MTSNTSKSKFENGKYVCPQSTIANVVKGKSVIPVSRTRNSIQEKHIAICDQRFPRVALAL